MDSQNVGTTLSSDRTAVAVGADVMSEPSVELNEGSIYLNYRQLHSLPSRLFEREIANGLRRLYLRHNCLHSLPTEMGQLRCLTDLYLQSNNLHALPEELCELSSLQMLTVSENHLTSLPHNLGKLQNLKRLQLSKNHLTHIPPEIGQLQNLQFLGLSQNHLHHLPVQLSGCQNLSSLYLDGNSLTNIPRQLCSLPYLKEISACNNQLVSLPQGLGLMSVLEAVYVDNNCYLTAVPSSTLHKNIGFCSCGTVLIPDNLLKSVQYISIQSGEDKETVIAMPPELRGVGSLQGNCVPMLLELALRVAHRLLEQGVIVAADNELPTQLLSNLNTPTAQCQHCNHYIFVMGFPIVFRAQVKDRDLLLLGLCCSAACVRQSSLIVHLPLLYPSLEDLSLAIVIA